MMGIYIQVGIVKHRGYSKMNVYEKIRKVFRKKKKFIVTKTWLVNADNTKEAIEIASKKRYNWIQVIPNSGGNDNDE